MKTLAPRPSPLASLRWPPRPRREVRNDTERKIWQSACGRYRVVRSRCLLGGRLGYRPVVRVVVRDLSGWTFLSKTRHRKTGPAFREAEAAVRRNVQ